MYVTWHIAEVNGHRLLGMNHLEVVSILKELSSEVCMVCARPRPAPALDLAPPPPTLVKVNKSTNIYLPTCVILG